jgi:pyruvate ferredoxin oxidoreductase gamma subunit
VLGTAFFLEGFEVQDAPRYGAERRGAPIWAYVRAARRPIDERGVIVQPDLVVVADESLVGVAAAGVLTDVGPRTALLVRSDETAAVWRERLAWGGAVWVLPAPADEPPHRAGTTTVGAAARLVGVIGRVALEDALRRELAALADAEAAASFGSALAAFDGFEPHAGAVAEGSDTSGTDAPFPGWVDLPAEAARVAAPTIHAPATSVQVRTGLWRVMRPVIDYEHCRRCTWVCGTFCPDGAISVDGEGRPAIDYDHCKGCLVCVAVCPHHAIRVVPERDALAAETSS